jgi:hypothetical protein
VFRLVIAVALIIAGVLFSQEARSRGLPVDSSVILLVWVVIVFLGWLIFQFGVWSDSWHNFTSPQRIVLKTEKSPYQVLMDSVNSCAMTMIGGSVLIIIALSVTGHTDLVVQILDMLLVKLGKVLHAIFE